MCAVAYTILYTNYTNRSVCGKPVLAGMDRTWDGEWAEMKLLQNLP